MNLDFLIPQLNIGSILLFLAILFVIFGLPKIKTRWPGFWRKLTIGANIIFVGIILFAATGTTIFEVQYHLLPLGLILYAMLALPIGVLYEIRNERQIRAERHVI